MPSASDEDRALMEKYFGDPVSDHGPMKFLQDSGYTLHRDWTWSKPGVKTYDDMTRKEFECLKFLVHEWDMGGLHDSN